MSQPQRKVHVLILQSILKPLNIIMLVEPDEYSLIKNLLERVQGNPDFYYDKHLVSIIEGRNKSLADIVININGTMRFFAYHLWREI